MVQLALSPAIPLIHVVLFSSRTPRAHALLPLLSLLTDDQLWTLQHGETQPKTMKEFFARMHRGLAACSACSHPLLQDTPRVSWSIATCPLNFHPCHSACTHTGIWRTLFSVCSHWCLVLVFVICRSIVRAAACSFATCAIMAKAYAKKPFQNLLWVSTVSRRQGVPFACCLPWKHKETKVHCLVCLFCISPCFVHRCDKPGDV